MRRAISAQRYWQAEPYNAGGLFAKVAFCRWRFGRVFDRFQEMPIPE